MRGDAGCCALDIKHWSGPHICSTHARARCVFPCKRLRINLARMLTHAVARYACACICCACLGRLPQAFAPVPIALFPYSAAQCHPSRIDSRPSILAPSICTSCYGGRISMVLRRLRVPPMMVPMSTRRVPRCLLILQNTAREASPLLKLSIAEVERKKEHRRLRRKTWPERVRRCEPASPCGVASTPLAKNM